VQTHSNVLQYYGVRTSKADAVPAAAAGSGASGPVPVKRLDVFLERSVVIEGSALCMDIVGDSRALLLGMADGSLRTYSWHAQVQPPLTPWLSHSRAFYFGAKKRCIRGLASADSSRGAQLA
jgi:hypothetical protein